MRTCVCVSVRTKSRSGRPWEPPARSRFSRTDRRGWRDSGWGLMYDICGKVTSCWWQSPTAQRWLQEPEAEEEAYFLWFTEQFQVKGFDQLAVKRHAGCLPNGSSNCMAEWRVQRLFFLSSFHVVFGFWLSRKFPAIQRNWRQLMFIFVCLKRNSLCLPDNFFIDEVLGLLVQFPALSCRSSRERCWWRSPGWRRGRRPAWGSTNCSPGCRRVTRASCCTWTMTLFIH